MTKEKAIDILTNRMKKLLDLANGKCPPSDILATVEFLTKKALEIKVEEGIA